LSVKAQHSDPFTTTGLIKTLYNFILDFLDISLLWNIFLFAKKARLPVAILSFMSYSSTVSLTSALDVGGGTWWRSWLRNCATSLKVTGSIPNGVIGIFH
jgi:hypothetical protein